MPACRSPGRASRRIMASALRSALLALLAAHLGLSAASLPSRPSSRPAPDCVPLWPRGAPGALGTGPEDIPELCLFPASRTGKGVPRAGDPAFEVGDKDPGVGGRPAGTHGRTTGAHGGTRDRASGAEDTLEGGTAGAGPGGAAGIDRGGAAAVIFPGGAYGILALEKEGFQVAEWLNSLGMSAFVLKYRLGPRYRHPAPITDAKRAMRWVRAHAAEWGVDPLRIGVVGFSAGGHLAATVATRYDGGRSRPDDDVDRYPCQPAFQVLVYPVITMVEPFGHRASRGNLLGPAPDPALAALLSNERHVTAAAPPAFLAHARTDPIVPWRNSQAYAEACRRAGVPAELRIYETGTHAFGLARAPGPAAAVEPSDWPAHCARWLERQGMLAPSRKAAAGTRGP